MGPMFYNGSLLFVDGTWAMHERCCCVQPCDCSSLPDTLYYGWDWGACGFDEFPLDEVAVPGGWAGVRRLWRGSGNVAGGTMQVEVACVTDGLDGEVGLMMRADACTGVLDPDIPPAVPDWRQFIVPCDAPWRNCSTTAPPSACNSACLSAFTSCISSYSEFA